MPFTPDFAVQGIVQNQNGTPKAGWTVYLDLNNDGTRDANDPSVVTNADGFYSFLQSSVPANKPFHVHLVVPAPGNYNPVVSPMITYDGETTQSVPFALEEHSAIEGLVFVDFEQRRCADRRLGSGGRRFILTSITMGCSIPAIRPR